MPRSKVNAQDVRDNTGEEIHDLSPIVFWRARPWMELPTSPHEIAVIVDFAHDRKTKTYLADE
jgi:hypothetical protein